MIYGYVRNLLSGNSEELLSSDEQAALIRKEYPGARICEEIESRNPRDWTVLSDMLGKVRKNDTVVLADLLYAPVTLEEAAEMIQYIFDRGAALHILNFQLLKKDTYGKTVLSTVKLCAGLEHSYLGECNVSCNVSSQNRDEFRNGKRAKYSQEQIDAAVELLNGHTLIEVAAVTGISKSTLSREARRKKAGEQGQ